MDTTTAAIQLDEGDSSQSATPQLLKSTWRHKNRSEWTLYHWFYQLFDLHPTDMNKPVPVYSLQSKVPHLSNWSYTLWTLVHGCLPVLLHQIYIVLFNRTMSIWQVMVLYNVAAAISSLRGRSQLRILSHQLGFFDGKTCTRPGVPDTGVVRVFYTLNTLLTGRCTLIAFVAYSSDQAPADIAWHWLLLKMAAYSVTFDFWFYWYHRAMHEVSFLRKHHRIHHLSKYPTTLMTAYSDLEQSLIDYIVLPTVAYFFLNTVGVQLGFYEWYICNLQGLMTEMGGHSGLRIHACPANILTPILSCLNCDLSIEDHDIHHRVKWKESGNYGTQTRIWDTLFCTRKERIETSHDNIDWDNAIHWPLF